MADKILAFHFDMKRPMWTREYMDAMVDRLAGWGFTHILYEIEDKFRWTNHPAISHPDAPTNDETADFVASCRSKGVDVIPLMQALGHAECVVGKPEYAHLRERRDVDNLYDATSDASRELLVELFDEIIDVFQPREFFHMGGDETRSLGTSEKAKPLVEALGIGGLYLHHMRPLFERLHGKGLRPVIWADIVLAHPEVIADVPQYVVMLDWDYRTGAERFSPIHLWGGQGMGYSSALDWEGYRKLLAEGASSPVLDVVAKYAVDERSESDGLFNGFYCTDVLNDYGFDVITGSANRCAGDMVGVPRFATHLPNVFHFARKGNAAGLGHVVTCWAVRHNHPEVGLLGAFAAPYALGTDGPLDLDAMGRAFTADFHGVEMPEFMDAAMKAQAAWGVLCQAAPIADARRRFGAGEDPMALPIEDCDVRYGSRDAAVKALGEHIAGYKEARGAFEAMKGQAARNAENFDFWIEGIDLDVLYGEFMLAALKDTLTERAHQLLGRLERLREHTRPLFARTYPALSVEQELDLRYGFHEDYLRSVMD